ncbi:uncharacterized protein A4U43_C07F6710 [Asparagus officinalis]|uniref:WRKY domain-containing protein n=1 Tax=Asparagus officinalis TaxID=4686 RepID=A0A5P1E9V9_ASPOF|nr:probable WRKY transcription factor 70 [Asparagus officinalis]ONK62666.1 uncharacterized protein A4U43_C07F6710 [Asparagus officinalis]
MTSPILSPFPHRYPFIYDPSQCSSLIPLASSPQSTTTMKTLPSISTAAVEELTKGREIAAKLSVVLRKEESSGDSTSAAGGLIEEIISSFSRALDVLGSAESAGDDGIPAMASGDVVGSESCGKKRRSGAVGRGGFRKRKQASQWRTVLSKTCTDDYSWRKYGQKVIHSSKFPRSYFRCTHKYDQGCQAIKQVQVSENDPSNFLMTYIGEHSCNNPNIIPTIIQHNNSIEPSMISFGSNISDITQENPLPPSPLFSKTQENDEEVEVISKNLTPATASSEYFDLPDFGDISGLNSSTGNLDMSFIADSFNFEDDMFSFHQFGDVHLS